MDIKFDIKNPFLASLAVLALIVGGGWFAWKNPERFKEIIRSSYDDTAIVDNRKLQAALEPDMIVFLRHELIKEAVTSAEGYQSTDISANTPITITKIQSNPVDYYRNSRDFALARKDRRVRLKFNYETPNSSGKALGEANLSRAGSWSLTSVELDNTTD